MNDNTDMWKTLRKYRDENNRLREKAQELRIANARLEAAVANLTSILQRVQRIDHPGIIDALFVEGDTERFKPIPPAS